MNFVVMIPVRFFSTRFPGKALADIHGKPMIIRVLENALDSGANRVIVATDSVNIAQVIKSEQSIKGSDKVCLTLTRSNHQSGTERLAEVAARYKFPDDQIIVHLQGDEPLISPIMIRKVASTLSLLKVTTSMATLAVPLNFLKEAYDDNIVKVVVDKNNNALYFSRSMIPWHRIFHNSHQDSKPCGVLLRHIGIYSYRVKFLRNYIDWIKSPLEEFEQLEQLRVLWHGEMIHVSIIDDVFHASVDTPEALKCIDFYFKKKK